MITRTCRGNFEALIFLNRGKLEALRHLFDAYIVTEDTDPYLPQLKRIHQGIVEKK